MISKVSPIIALIDDNLSVYRSLKHIATSMRNGMVLSFVSELERVQIFKEVDEEADSKRGFPLRHNFDSK